MIFLDSSVLAKVYVEEEGTGTVLGLIDRMDGALFVSDFIALEVLTTLRIVFRHVSRARYQEVIGEFFRDFPSRYNLVDVTPRLHDDARSLTIAERTAKARAMDVLHVACALDVQARFPARQVTMASSDLDLLDLARSAGLRTFDPRIEPLAALPKRPF